MENCSSNKNPPSNPPNKNGENYVWQQVEKNPNLFCWVSKENKDDFSLQDIPSFDLEDVILQKAEEALYNKTKEAYKKLEKRKSDEDLVSVDDPRKYPIVKDFIVKKGLKIYGGVAINSYLGKEDKIYDATDIPDYDFFSTSPWEDAVELGDLFYKKGYKYVEVKAGIHKGTYKVYVNLWPVADISYMPKKEFDKIQVKKINGLPVVHPYKLLESMYKEFSEPYSNPARWSKVAIREKILRKWVKPFSEKLNCENENKIPEEISKLVNESVLFFSKKDIVFSGDTAYNFYMKLGDPVHNKISSELTKCSVLSETPKEDIDNLFTILMKKKDSSVILEIITTVYPAKEINNTVYCVKALFQEKIYDVCEIIYLTSCVPYIKDKKVSIASIDYIKYELFDRIVFSDSKEETVLSKCKIKNLEKVQEYYYKKHKLNETDKSPFERFISKCKGPFKENTKVAALEKIKEQTEARKNMIIEWTPLYKIKKMKRSSIDTCKFSKEDCKYPCTWNKNINKCTEIPKGIYRPGQDNSDILES